MTYGVTTQRCPGVYVTRQHNITLSVRVVGRGELQSYTPQWGELGSVESIAVVPERDANTAPRRASEHAIQTKLVKS